MTIRYDPRDMGEVRVFHRNAFLCRAVSMDHAGNSIALKDIQAARVAYRRQLRCEIREKTAKVADYLPTLVLRAVPRATPAPPPKSKEPVTSAPKRRLLRTYHEDD